jgi:hypothetical protein
MLGSQGWAARGLNGARKASRRLKTTTAFENQGNGMVKQVLISSIKN